MSKYQQVPPGETESERTLFLATGVSKSTALRTALVAAGAKHSMPPTRRVANRVPRVGNSLGNYAQPTAPGGGVPVYAIPQMLQTPVAELVKNSKIVRTIHCVNAHHHAHGLKGFFAHIGHFLSKHAVQIVKTGVGIGSLVLHGLEAVETGNTAPALNDISGIANIWLTHHKALTGTPEEPPQLPWQGGVPPDYGYTQLHDRWSKFSNSVTGWVERAHDIVTATEPPDQQLGPLGDSLGAAMGPATSGYEAATTGNSGIEESDNKRQWRLNCLSAISPAAEDWIEVCKAHMRGHDGLNAQQTHQKHDRRAAFRRLHNLLAGDLPITEGTAGVPGRANRLFLGVTAAVASSTQDGALSPDPLQWSSSLLSFSRLTDVRGASGFPTDRDIPLAFSFHAPRDITTFATHLQLLCNVTKITGRLAMPLDMAAGTMRVLVVGKRPRDDITFGFDSPWYSPANLEEYVEHATIVPSSEGEAILTFDHPITLPLGCWATAESDVDNYRSRFNLQGSITFLQTVYSEYPVTTSPPVFPMLQHWVDNSGANSSYLPTVPVGGAMTMAIFIESATADSFVGGFIPTTFDIDITGTVVAELSEVPPLVTPVALADRPVITLDGYEGAAAFYAGGSKLGSRYEVSIPPNGARLRHLWGTVDPTDPCEYTSGRHYLEVMQTESSGFVEAAKMVQSILSRNTALEKTRIGALSNLLSDVVAQGSPVTGNLIQGFRPAISHCGAVEYTEAEQVGAFFASLPDLLKSGSQCGCMPDDAVERLAMGIKSIFIGCEEIWHFSTTDGNGDAELRRDPVN